MKVESFLTILNSVWSLVSFKIMGFVLVGCRCGWVSLKKYEADFGWC